MKNQSNMNINKDTTDAFLSRALSEVPLEEPGQEFIPSLMDKIEMLSTNDSKANISRPIISVQIWFVMGIVAALIFVALFFTSPSSLSFPAINIIFGTLAHYVPTITISPTFLTATLAFIFFFIIEVFVISGQINKPKITA